MLREVRTLCVVLVLARTLSAAPATRPATRPASRPASSPASAWPPLPRTAPTKESLENAKKWSAFARNIARLREEVERLRVKSKECDAAILGLSNILRMSQQFIADAKMGRPAPKCYEWMKLVKPVIGTEGFLSPDDAHIVQVIDDSNMLVTLGGRMFWLSNVPTFGQIDDSDVDLFFVPFRVKRNKQDPPAIGGSNTLYELERINWESIKGKDLDAIQAFHRSVVENRKRKAKPDNETPPPESP
jgi:hypothetical protein